MTVPTKVAAAAATSAAVLSFTYHEAARRRERQQLREAEQLRMAFWAGAQYASKSGT